MSLIAYTYTLTNGTLADADQVMDNFNKISAVVNGNIDNTNINLSTNWVWTGTHTFSAGNLKIKGAGSGVASLQYANSSNNRTITIPDPGSDSTLVALAGSQSISGVKTFAANSLALAGASTGIATFLNANTAVNSNVSIIYGPSTTSSLVANELKSTPGIVDNLSITISGSTLTIKSGDGSTSLSAGNPGYASIRSTTAGVTKVVSFTSNVAVTFGAASDTDGNLFGIAAADWSNSMPMFLGIIYDGTTPYFCISRLPLQTSGAAAASLCQLGDTDGDATTDVMILTTGLTLANWVNLPITQVGWFNATFTNATSSWTFSVDTTTGFNHNYEAITFTFPQAQNGGGGTAAGAGSHILTNGGTIPQFSTETYVYSIDRHGMVHINVYYQNDAGTDGATAVDTLFSVPYAQASNTYQSHAIGYVNAAGVGANFSDIFIDGPGSTSQIGMIRNNTATTTTPWQHSNFSNGGRNINFSMHYRAV